MTYQEKLESYKIRKAKIDAGSANIPQLPADMHRNSLKEQDRIRAEVKIQRESILSTWAAESVQLYNEASSTLKSIVQDIEGKKRPLMSSYDSQRRQEGLLQTQLGRESAKLFMNDMEGLWNEHYRLGILKMTDAQTELLETAAVVWKKDNKDSYMKLLTLKNEHYKQLGIPELQKLEKDFKSLLENVRVQNKLINAGATAPQNHAEWLDGIRRAGLEV